MVQQDKDKYASILKEVSRWKSLKIITNVQAEKIKSLYKHGASEEKRLGITNYIAIFGSIMIGVGVILFFALNWSSIPKSVKVISIMAGMIASYHIGYLMKFEKVNLPRVGGALIFLGGIIYGAGIVLIAQIFNISTHWPSGFLYWAVGLIPIAYLILSLPVIYLALIGFGFYVGSEAYYWFGYVERYYNISYAFFLIFLSLGIFYYCLGSIHEKKGRIAKLSYPFHLLGSLLMLFTVYLLSFKYFGERYVPNDRLSVLFQSKFWIIYMAVSALAVIALYLAFKLRDKKDKAEFYELFYPAVLLIFTSVVVLFSSINFWLMPIIFNIILLLLILGTIHLGYAKKQQMLVNIGVLMFGISVVSRYVEYLWNELNGYLFFIIGGILLIALSILLERKRRTIIERIKN